MKENERPLSFGRYLRAVRREKGIRLERVSKETRIGLETLNLIEREEISGLPAEVFVKGFIRSYARAVGADADRAVAGYRQSLARLQKTEQSEADLDRLSSRFWPHMMMAAGILFAVIAASIFALSGLQREEKPPSVTEPAPAPTTLTPAEKAPAPEETAVPEHRPAMEPAPEPGAGASPPSPPPAESDWAAAPDTGEPGRMPVKEKQVLEITAVAETWMKIIIDDDKTKEVTLNPGDRLALEASTGYDLLIGNAAGIQMQLNGEPIEIEGRSGQVRSLRLP